MTAPRSCRPAQRRCPCPSRTHYRQSPRSTEVSENCRQKLADLRAIGPQQLWFSSDSEGFARLLLSICECSQFGRAADRNLEANRPTLPKTLRIQNTKLISVPLRQATRACCITD